MTTQILTKAQAEALGSDYKRLIEMTEQQLTEHKAWLRTAIAELQPEPYGLQASDLDRLWYQVNEIKFESVQITQTSDGLRVTIANDYPDMLHAFLMRSDIPDKLSLRAQGGITVINEPTARRV